MDFTSQVNWLLGLSEARDRATCRQGPTPDITEIANSLDHSNRLDLQQNIVDGDGDHDDPVDRSGIPVRIDLLTRPHHSESGFFSRDDDLTSGIGRSVIRTKLPENAVGATPADKTRLAGGNPNDEPQEGTGRDQTSWDMREDHDASEDAKRMKEFTAAMCDACASAFRRMQGQGSNMSAPALKDAGICSACVASVRKAIARK